MGRINSSSFFLASWLSNFLSFSSLGDILQETRRLASDFDVETE
jgi:hypothetical protein